MMISGLISKRRSVRSSVTILVDIKTVIRYIKKHCPNIRFICRHFDVNDKHCPARYMDSTKWAKLKVELMKAL